MKYSGHPPIQWDVQVTAQDGTIDNREADGSFYCQFIICGMVPYNTMLLEDMTCLHYGLSCTFGKIGQSRFHGNKNHILTKDRSTDRSQFGIIKKKTNNRSLYLGRMTKSSTFQYIQQRGQRQHPQCRTT